MKADALPAGRPVPVILPPSSFADPKAEPPKPSRTVEVVGDSFVPTMRPREPITVGLRRLSADEFETAHATAVRKADELHKANPLAHEDPEWRKSYEGYWLRVVLGRALCKPTNAIEPMWPFQRDPAVIGTILSLEGMGRLYDALEPLMVTGDPTRRELTNEEVEAMAEELLDGTFFEAIDVAALPEADRDVRRAGVERQVRRLLAFVCDLRGDAGLRL